MLVGGVDACKGRGGKRTVTLNMRKVTSDRNHETENPVDAQDEDGHAGGDVRYVHRRREAKM